MCFLKFRNGDLLPPQRSLQPKPPICHPDATATFGSRRVKRSAFTLVELMVVIVIIGLLSGAVAVSVRSYLIAGKQNVARLEVAKIRQAIDTYYTAFDRYPTNDEGIAALVEPSDKFADGLLNKMPVDPWGNEYEYIQPGRSGPYTIISYGADAQEGGSGADSDITNDDVNNAKN